MSSVGMLLAALADAVQQIRQSTDTLLERGDAYLVVESGVATRADGLIAGLMATSGAIRDDGVLAESLRVLEAATEARMASALQLTNYFASTFPDPAELGVEGAALVEQHVLREQAIGKVRSINTGREVRATRLQPDCRVACRRHHDRRRRVIVAPGCSLGV